MSWYDPTSWDWSGALGLGSGDPSNPYRSAAAGVGQAGLAFGNQAAQNYNNMTGQLGAQADYLRSIQGGQTSLAGEQLRQGLQQGMAAQRSMAAAANPANQAMAARNAAMNMGRLSYGLSGQQATAGIQERNAAAQQLGQLLTNQRGQDVQGALGGYNSAASAYNAALSNPQKTWGDVAKGAAGGFAAALPMLFSDKRLKRDIADGDDDAERFIGGLNAVTYKYRDQEHGKGKQLGLLAQDLEKVLPSAVYETPIGKAVDSGRLSAAVAATLPGIDRRLSQLERMLGDDGAHGSSKRQVRLSTGLSR